MLLYFEAAFAFLSLLNVGFGGSLYSFSIFFLASGNKVGDPTVVVQFIVFAAALAYVYAGWAIANEQKRGWIVGVVVAGGAILVPLASGEFGTLFHDYLFTLLFNVALFVLLVHRESRSYQRIWFH